MIRLWLLVALAVLTHHHPVAVALVALAAAGAVAWFLVRCLRWPAVTVPLDDSVEAFA